MPQSCALCLSCINDASPVSYVSYKSSGIARSSFEYLGCQRETRRRWVPALGRASTVTPYYPAAAQPAGSLACTQSPAY